MQTSPFYFSRLALAVNLALLSLAVSQPVAAQATPEEAKKDEKTLATVRVTADKPAEIEAKESYQVLTTRIGKGKQALRDIPQSVTVVTEKLIDDRNLETLKDVLHQTSGITFLAAEGGEEDVRLRGFSLQQTGDIYVDGMRDPAIYQRDTFNYDRVEVLRGSASMLFGRGSTGGVVNQVSKKAFLLDQNEINTTYGTGNYARVETDMNMVTGTDSAVRLTAMKTLADNDGAGSSIDKEGAALDYRYGIGLRDEFDLALFYLKNRNGINYGTPWVAPNSSTVDRTLLREDPSTYHGADSDYANSDIVHGTITHTHRFSGDAELKTAFRVGKYARDQRASAVRFASASAQPDGVAATEQSISDNTVLTRSNSNNKIMDHDNQVLQSDYSDKFKWLGMTHSVLTGVDFNHEFRTTYGVVGGSTKSNTTVGDDDGGGGINEEARFVRRSAAFDVSSAGTYLQDLVQVAEHWKLLSGLRWDYVDGKYKSYSTSDGSITGDRGRHDSLWSKRFGALYQPTPETSYHLSYGTSYNTSGDTYQYDAKTSNTPPEMSRNIELGSKLDLAGGDLTTRFALFHATKYNERNTDSDSVTADNYVLSAQRYSKGFETDIAGRINKNWETYFSYTWIPVAKIKKGASGSNETVGQRPGLIPKHQASLWSTYKLGQDWRVGAGANGRTKMNPQLVTDFKVDGYVTYDAMVEYQLSQAITLKLNGSNLTNKLYADNVYRGHYVAGKGRTFMLTAGYKF
jgi:catecholate siderophore receptor